MPVKITLIISLFLLSPVVRGQREIVSIPPPKFKNIWNEPPRHIPNNVSIDAPLMGNGDITMSLGYNEDGRLRYYLSKNDFWRLQSKADGLSGPRVVGFIDIQLDGFGKGKFSAEQLIRNGLTTCRLTNKNAPGIEAQSWVSATENLIFIELKAINKASDISINLTAPENKRAILKEGHQKETYWLSRAFVERVDIPTEVAVALKSIPYKSNKMVLQPGKKLIIAIAIESKFDHKKPLEYALNSVRKINKNTVNRLFQQHNKWWDNYWNKSCLTVEDTVLMKAYYQGLYTMAACSRDQQFPPGIFGWTTTDSPSWNGDYHLNYNFQAPFYALAAANRLQQTITQDQPLLDFMPRGAWYAKNITNTRGILYPVGIGPLGIETTRDFISYRNSNNFEKGGLFFGQRSNAVYGLINMAQYWRCTYDKKYGEKIYPYVMAVVNFWEDYLKFENGRYVIYDDAIQEGTGKDKNPILSLGLIRNAINLAIDLSSTLKKDENRQAKWKDILRRLSDYPVQIRNGKKVFRYTEQGVAWWQNNGLGIQHIYPSNGINLNSNAQLLKIARNTIDEMQRWQDLNTSNSFFMAAIRVGYDSSVVMKELHKYALHTYPNGFQFNNPHGIENSCTVANALNEMLCMSVGDVIRLFSMYPRNQKAAFQSIRTWGAFLVSARLENEEVNGVKIISEKERPCTIANPWKNHKVRLIRNGINAEVLEGNKLCFKTASGETIRLKPL